MADAPGLRRAEKPRGIRCSLRLVNVLRVLLLGAALLVRVAEAKPPAAARSPAGAKAPPAAPVVLPPGPVTLPDPSAPPAQLVAQLNELYQNLEYERVVPFAEACLKRADLPVEQQLEVYRLLGSAKAIVEDPVDAEKPFRLLLRARPDYELQRNTPPKILAVFRKVQTEEKALASKLREVERERVVAGLKLLDELPNEARGGRPLDFSLRLRDPGSAIDSVRVAYRRAGEKDFSTLALARGEQGDWRGSIPGDFTASKDGFPLEYYVETADAEGPLLTVGAAPTPRTLSVLPGLLQQRAFKPIPRAATWAAVALTAAAGLSAGGFGIALSSRQAAYNQLAATSGADGAQLTSIARQGDALALGATISLVALAVTAVTTGVFLPLTDFEASR
jgi:hypothetical protein